MYQLAKENLLKDVLNSVFSVFVVYACEMLQVQHKYPGAIRWFAKRKKLVDREIVLLVDKLMVDKSDVMAQLLDISYSKDEIIFLLTHSYWDSFCYENIAYDESFFCELGIEKQELVNLYNSITKKVRKEIGLDFGFDDPSEFCEKYLLSGLVSKEKMLLSIFKFFKIYHMLEYKKDIFKHNDLPIILLELFKEIPFYSIRSKSSINEVILQKTEMGQRQYLQLRVPIDSREGKIADNLVHFMFQHLVKLFKFYFFQSEKENFDVWRFDKAIIKAWKEPNISIEDIDGDIFAFDENEQYLRIKECISIIDGLQHNLPRGLSGVLSNKIDNKDLLLSVLYAYFIRQYDYENVLVNGEKISSKIEEEEIKSNATKTKKFLFYLENGFREVGLELEARHLKNAEKSTIFLQSDNKNWVTISGKTIQDNFRNHRIFFNKQ